MKFADYIQREVVNPVDLQILDKTYNTLEQGHQSAIQATSALQAEMAKLDLNEAESGWRQQKIDEIKATLENNSYMGNAYHALDDLTRLSGDLFSNPELLGRLQAQKDYKDYINNLDRRTDLTEEKKEYYRDVNKYSYSETIDPETGAITPSKWTPIDKEVSEVPLANILENARKWMIEDSGYTTEFSFLDKDGNVVTDPSKSYTGEIYMKKGNQWIRMPEDKVRRAIEASINSIPGARESLQQDYKIAKWRYNKYGNEGGANNPLIDKNGQIRTAEGFLEARINPFVKENTYYKSHPTIEYGDALKSYKLAQINKEAIAEQNIQQQQSYNEAKTSLSTPISPIRVVNNFATESVQELNYIDENISRILTSLFPEDNVDVKKLDLNAIYEYYKKAIDKDKELATELYDYYTKRMINEDYISKIKEGSDDQDAAAFDLYNAIDAMSELPQDDYGYRDGYNALFNWFWNGNRQAIRQYFVHDDTYQAFIDNIGGEDVLNQLGITIGVNNGKKYVELAEKNKYAFEKFARASQNAIMETHNVFGLIWQDTKGIFNSKAGDNITVIVNGEERHNYDIFTDEPTPFPSSHNGAHSYIKYLKYVDKLKQQRDDVYKQPYLTIETSAMSQATPGLVELATIMKTNPENASKYSTAYKVEETEAKNAIIVGLDLTRWGAFVLNDENNLFEDVPSKKEKEITQLLRNAKDTDINIMCIFDPSTGMPSPLINLKYKDGDKDKSVTFYSVGGFNNSTIESWNRETEFRAKSDIVRYTAAGKGFEVTDYQSFGNTTKLFVEPSPKGYILKSGKDEGVPITLEEAIQLREMYYDWSQTLQYVKLYPNQINEQALNGIINKTAEILSNYIDNGGTENYFRYILIEQLNKPL